MGAIQVIFWVCAAGVLYAYVGYPLLLLAASRLRPRPVMRAQGALPPSVSIVVAGFNEEQRIAGRRDELAATIRAEGFDGEVIVVSDGSTDGTAAAARDGVCAADRVRVIELPRNVGKAEAISRGVAAATGDVVVFADARQRWAPDALRRLLENFDDPAVGGVSGDLCLESDSGLTSGVGVYWKYEKAVRKLESRLHSTVGATGAISAVRRPLFRPIPQGTLLDDVYWPMCVVMQRRRVVHDGRAVAFDRLPARARDEWRRKVRTLSGNFQLTARLPALLLPWRNPVWLQFLSHKLLRVAVPWLLVAMLVCSAAAGGAVYRTALLLQACCYLLALAGLHRAAARFRPASAAAAFLLLNAAAFVSFWVWALGLSGTSWKKVTYDAGATAPALAPSGPDVL